MSDNFIVERYSTRIDRMGGLVRKALETNNPLAEEMSEALIDLLDSVMEQQNGMRKSINDLLALVKYMTETPNVK